MLFKIIYEDPKTGEHVTVIKDFKASEHCSPRQRATYYARDKIVSTGWFKIELTEDGNGKT